MTEEFYKLRHKSTGLYLSGIEIIPPLTKKGVPSKARTIPWRKRVNCKHKVSLKKDIAPQDILNIKYQIEQAIYYTNEMNPDDFEFEKFVYQNVPNDVDLENIINDYQQELLADKLRYGP